MFGSSNQDPFLSSSRSVSDPQKRDSNRRMYSPHSPYFSQHPDPRTAPNFLQDSNARERLPDSDLTSHQMIFSTESPGGGYFPNSTHDFSSPTGSKQMDLPASAYHSALSQTSGCKPQAYSVYARSARHAYGSPEADCSPVGSPMSMSSPASLSSGLPSGPSDDETCSTTAGPLRPSPWEEQAFESVHRSQSVRRRGETRGNSSSGNRSPLLKPMPPSRNRNAAILTRISSDPDQFTYPPTDFPAHPVRGRSPFAYVPARRRPPGEKELDYLAEQLEPRLDRLEAHASALLKARLNSTARMLEDMTVEDARGGNRSRRAR